MSFAVIDFQSNPLYISNKNCLDERDLRVLKQELNNGEKIDLPLYINLIPYFESYLKNREVNQEEYIKLQEMWNYEVNLENTIYIGTNSFNDLDLSHCLLGFTLYLLLTDRIKAFGQDLVCMDENGEFTSYRLEFQEVKKYHMNERTLINKKLLYNTDYYMQGLPGIFKKEYLPQTRLMESIRIIKENYYYRIQWSLTQLSDNGKISDKPIIKLNNLDSNSLDDLLRKKIIYAWARFNKDIYIKLHSSDVDYHSIIKEKKWRTIEKIEAEDLVHYTHRDYIFWKKYCSI